MFRKLQERVYNSLPFRLIGRVSLDCYPHPAMWELRMFKWGAGLQVAIGPFQFSWEWDRYRCWKWDPNWGWMVMRTGELENAERMAGNGTGLY